MTYKFFWFILIGHSSIPTSLITLSKRMVTPSATQLDLIKERSAPVSIKNVPLPFFKLEDFEIEKDYSITSRYLISA